MPDKLKQLQQVQIAPETTWGTVVAPTTNLIEFNELSITPNVEIDSVTAQGTIAPSTAAVVMSSNGSASGSFRANLERMHFFLDSLFGAALASGAGPYTRSYSASISANPVRSFFTLIHGDATSGVSLAGSIVSSLTFNIKKGFITVDIDFVGKHVETGSIATLALPTTTYLKGSQCVVSIADLNSSFTDLDCDALDLKISISNNTSIRHGLGTVAGCTYNTGNWDATLELMAEYENATAKPIKTAMLGTSPSLVQKEIKATITSGSYSLTLTFVGYLDGAGDFYADTDGVVTADLSFVGQYDPASSISGSFFRAVLVNGVSN